MSEPLSRRAFGQSLGLGLGAWALSGCSDFPAGMSLPPDGVPPESDRAPDENVWRVLNRLGYGPRPGDVERVQAIGIDAYLEEQLAPESIAEDPALSLRLAGLESLSLSPEQAREQEWEWVHANPVSKATIKLMQLPILSSPSGPGACQTELQQARVLRCVYSRRQLNEAMVEFWCDHFNIDQGKGDCAWLTTINEAELRRHALGKFRDLLWTSMHSPAMLAYLDNSDNVRQAAAGDPPPNENYARELLELQTLGVSGGYTLEDIQEVSRCLTGWSVQTSWELRPGEFTFRPERHDDGAKRVLGIELPAGRGRRDGEDLVEILSRHPSTAQFLCTKLCRRFVADLPPPSLVSRLANVFQATDGDLRKVLAELFRSPEFLTGQHRKFKRPFDFVVSALRSTGVRTNGLGVLPYLAEMGQSPFRCPLPDGFPDRVEAWVHTLRQRWQFAIDLAQGRIAGAEMDPDVREADHNSEQTFASAIARQVLGRALPDPQMQALLALQDERRPGDFAAVVRALCLSSPYFQWR
jgi:uncharacterized protein (DUF1800 family)